MCKLKEEFGLFAIKRLWLASGLVNKVCNETVRNLWKNKGWKFVHSRKTELLKRKNLKERLTFPRKIKIFQKSILTEEIWFYLDWADYQHKHNLFDKAKSVKSMTWRQQSEGLDYLCAAKGSHNGSGERIAHFTVATSF